MKELRNYAGKCLSLLIRKNVASSSELFSKCNCSVYYGGNSVDFI